MRTSLFVAALITASLLAPEAAQAQPGAKWRVAGSEQTAQTPPARPTAKRPPASRAGGVARTPVAAPAPAAAKPEKKHRTLFTALRDTLGFNKSKKPAQKPAADPFQLAQRQAAVVAASGSQPVSAKRAPTAQRIPTNAPGRAVTAAATIGQNSPPRRRPGAPTAKRPMKTQTVFGALFGGADKPSKPKARPVATTASAKPKSPKRPVKTAAPSRQPTDLARSLAMPAARVPMPASQANPPRPFSPTKTAAPTDNESVAPLTGLAVSEAINGVPESTGPVPLPSSDVTPKANPFALVEQETPAPEAVTPATPEQLAVAPATTPEPAISSFENATATPALGGPSLRVRSLLAEAHEFAAIAATLEDYTAVVKRCRYVLAIGHSTESAAYANQLAGWALTCRAELLQDESRSAEAKVDYLEAVRCDPECWRAEHALGVIAGRAGEIEAAIGHFERTLALNPEYAKAYANMAAVAVQEDNYEDALRQYAEAIEIDPDLVSAHSGRGRVCHILGMLDEGLRHLDAAEVLAPEDAAIAAARGDLLADMGRYGQAVAAYQRAVELDEDLAIAYRNLAWLQSTCPLDDFRNGEAALTNAQRAEELLGGSDDLTLDTKAAALAEMGRFEDAVETQQQALELVPPIDEPAYRERLAKYEQGQAYTSSMPEVVQASYAD